MNLTLCPIGGFPHCRGAGGLAAQHKFGAKSGVSIIILGAFKVTGTLGGVGRIFFNVGCLPLVDIGSTVGACGA